MVMTPAPCGPYLGLTHEELVAHLAYRYGGLGRVDILEKQPTMPDYQWRPLVLLW
jgi:hypothetical protein